MVSDNAADGFIVTAINAGDLMDCFEDYAGEFIAAIDGGCLIKCAVITVSYDAAYGLIATAIGGNLMDCDDDDECGLIDAIDSGD